MQDSYEEFIKKVSNWIDNIFISIPFDKSKVEAILLKDGEELRSMSAEDLLIDCVLLYKYIDFLQTAHNKEKAVLEFAENSILYLSSKNIENCGDKYTKWELKYNEGIKKDALSVNLFRLATTCRARVSGTEKRVEHVKKIADLIYQIGNSKKYDRN